MTRRARTKAVLAYFLAKQAPAATELQHRSPFELLVAVMLSAQCTDKRVNIVTGPLFATFPTAECMAEASFEELFPYIKSISYPNNKTRHILATARLLVSRHQGQIPQEVSVLQTLPGVGRKTAHVMAAELYGAPVMAVDTHIMRVAKRLALVPQQARTPLAIEKALTAAIPKTEIHRAHHWLLLHGRYTCTARKPKCAECGLREICPYAQAAERKHRVKS